MVLQQLSSRLPGGTLLGELVRNKALMLRDSDAYGKSQNFDLNGTLNKSPLTQINAFTGSLNALLALFGSPALTGALSGLGQLTGAMNAIEKAGQAHPAMAQMVATQAGHDGAIAAGLSVLWTAGKAVEKVGLPGVGRTAAAGARAGFAGLGIAVASQLIGDAIGAEFPAFGARRQKAMDDAKGPYYSNGHGHGGDAVQDIFDKALGRAMSAAPKGPPPAPIATLSKPLPVTVVNAGAIATGLEAHNANLFSQPPAGTTGPRSNSVPPWAGRPGVHG